MHSGCRNRIASIQHLFSEKIAKVYEVRLVRHSLCLLLRAVLQDHATVSSPGLGGTH
jgi:hypothetical protein